MRMTAEIDDARPAPTRIHPAVFKPGFFQGMMIFIRVAVILLNSCAKSHHDPTGKAQYGAMAVKTCAASI